MFIQQMCRTHSCSCCVGERLEEAGVRVRREGRQTIRRLAETTGEERTDCGQKLVQSILVRQVGQPVAHTLTSRLNETGVRVPEHLAHDRDHVCYMPRMRWHHLSAVCYGRHRSALYVDSEKVEVLQHRQHAAFPDDLGSIRVGELLKRLQYLFGQINVRDLLQLGDQKRNRAMLAHDRRDVRHNRGRCLENVGNTPACIQLGITAVVGSVHGMRARLVTAERPQELDEQTMHRKAAEEYVFGGDAQLLGKILQHDEAADWVVRCILKRLEKITVPLRHHSAASKEAAQVLGHHHGVHALFVYLLLLLLFFLISHMIIQLLEGIFIVQPVGVTLVRRRRALVSRTGHWGRCRCFSRAWRSTAFALACAAGI